MTYANDSEFDPLAQACRERDAAIDEVERLRIAICEVRDHLPWSPEIAVSIVRSTLRERVWHDGELRSVLPSSTESKP